MDQLVGQIIAQWGSFGLLLVIMGWFIYNEYTRKKEKEKSTNEITDDKFEVVDKKFDLLSQDLSCKYENIAHTIKSIDDRVDKLETHMAQQPEQVYQKFKDANDRKIEMHSALLQGRLNAGPRIHNILNIYSTITNSDHMAIGLFHNGTTTLTGIPYYKFDIVAEKFDIDNKNDHELAPLYKDTDIIRHNLLPLEIMQNSMMQYDIKPGCRLQDIDNILYGRTAGIGAKHLAIGIFKDENGLPAGFIGAANFKEEPINMEEFDKCLETIHDIYIDDLEKLKNIKEQEKL